MQRAIAAIVIIAVILALLWLVWNIYKHRAVARQNDPHKYLSRRDRKRIALEKANLELAREQQNERERVQKYIDPLHPDSPIWKELDK